MFDFLASPRHRDLKALAVLGLAVAWALVQLHHAFEPGYLLGWDTLGHIAKVAYWRKHLWPSGRWDGWFPYWHGGFQLFQFYPPGFYWATGLLSLWQGLEHASKVMTLAPYLLLPFSLYGAVRWLGLSPMAALAAGLLGLSLDSGYGSGPSALFLTGLVPNVWGVCLLPLVIAAWHGLLRQPTLRRSLLTALLTAVLLLTHTFSAYFAATATAIFFAFRLSDRHWRAIAYGAATGLLAVLLSATWLVPALVKYPWHGLIGEWEPSSPAQLAIELVQGQLFGTAVGALLGFCGVVLAWRHETQARELAVLAIVTSGLALGLINRFLPFGQVVGSTQFVRFHSYAGIVFILLAGFVVDYLWARRAWLRDSWRWEWPLGLLVMLFAADLLHLHDRLTTYPRLSSEVPYRQDIAAMMVDIGRYVPPHGRVLGEFHWDVANDYGTPHLTSQALALWAERADLAGNFPEGSLLAHPTLPLNQNFEPPAPDFVENLHQFGVSHVLTITGGAGRNLAHDRRFQRVATHGAMVLWALEPPGQLLQGPEDLAIAVVSMAQDQFAFNVASRGGPVTLAVNAYPNWQATWNGQLLPWHATDDHRMQVQLPAGEGQLVWAFHWQPWERACDWISAATWAACLILLGRSLLVDRNRLPLQASAR